MKKNLRALITISIIAVFILGTALTSQTELTANNAGAPAARTGSPGDTKSCTTCHTGTSQNAIGIISSNVPASGYTPGSTYTITAVCTDAAKNRFGFEMSPQNTTGTQQGTLVVTDVARTKLVGSGKYITHTAAGTSGTGTITWSFNWIAPPAGRGTVTMYGAFNFTNHNNASSGDVIKTSTLTFNEDLTSSIASISQQENIKLYPNPVNDVAHIIIPESSTVKRIQIFNLQGSLVREVEDVSPSQNFEINVSGLVSGTYYLSFATEKGNYSTKLIKL